MNKDWPGKHPTIGGVSNETTEVSNQAQKLSNQTEEIGISLSNLKWLFIQLVELFVVFLRRHQINGYLIENRYQ